MKDKIESKKKIVDGKVAVIISEGYGAGWYTWNLHCSNLIFDSILVDAILYNDKDKIKERAEELCPMGYFGSIEDGLTVCWVEQGKKFYITEYDGAEDLITENDFITA